MLMLMLIPILMLTQILVYSTNRNCSCHLYRAYHVPIVVVGKFVFEVLYLHPSDRDMENHRGWCLLGTQQVIRRPGIGAKFTGCKALVLSTTQYTITQRARIFPVRHCFRNMIIGEDGTCLHFQIDFLWTNQTSQLGYIKIPKRIWSGAQPVILCSTKHRQGGGDASSSLGVSSKHIVRTSAQHPLQCSPLEEQCLGKESSNYNKTEIWGNMAATSFQNHILRHLCRLDFSSVGKYVLCCFSLLWQMSLTITLSHWAHCCLRLPFKTCDSHSQWIVVGMWCEIYFCPCIISSQKQALLEVRWSISLAVGTLCWGLAIVGDFKTGLFLLCFYPSWCCHIYNSKICFEFYACLLPTSCQPYYEN